MENPYLDAIALFGMVVAAAIPYGIVFRIGQLIVDMFMGMAFGGKIKLDI